MSPFITIDPALSGPQIYDPVAVYWHARYYEYRPSRDTINWESIWKTIVRLRDIAHGLLWMQRICIRDET